MKNDAFSIVGGDYNQSPLGKKKKKRGVQWEILLYDFFDPEYHLNQ